MIDRRDFIKLAGAAILSLFAPEVNTMTFRPFEELLFSALDDAAHQRPIDPGTREELRLKAREIDEARTLVKGFVGTENKIMPRYLTIPIEVIYSSTFVANTASFDLHIPSDYKHLFIAGSGRATGAGTDTQYILGRFNGDTGTNYSQQKLNAVAASVTGEGNTGQTGALIGRLADGATSAGEAGGFFCIIPHYRGAYQKSVLMLNTPGYRDYVGFTGSIWQNTAAINDITFLPTDDSFAAGFALSVYGLR